MPSFDKFIAPEALDCYIRICLLQRIVPRTPLDRFAGVNYENGASFGLPSTGIAHWIYPNALASGTPVICTATQAAAAAVAGALGNQGHPAGGTRGGHLLDPAHKEEE